MATEEHLQDTAEQLHRELPVSVTTSTKPVPDQGRPNPSLEGGLGIQVHPSSDANGDTIVRYWEGGDSFLRVHFLMS